MLELTRTTGTGLRPGRLSSVADLGLDAIRAGQIGLVYHDDVSDFELAGLFPLQLVAGLWLHEDNDDIGDLANGDVPLAGADGLDNDGLEPKTTEQTDHEINVRHRARMTAGRGQTSHEHMIVIGPVGHADAITEQSTAGAESSADRRPAPQPTGRSSESRR